MKQVLLIAVLAAGMLLAGCSKDSENNGMEFTISESSISLLAHDDYKIIPSGSFTARSNNEDVATVSSDGTIHGVSAGDADIIFTSTENNALSQTCKVSVDWRYKYFEEPVIAFGATKEEIKARETHEPTYEEDDRIRYEYPKRTEIQTAVRYYFGDNGKVNRITIAPYGQRYADYDEKIVQQLTERYGNPSETSVNTIVFHPHNTDFTVNYYHHIGGGYAEYIPNDE